jgi:hypothetical protein
VATWLITIAVCAATVLLLITLDNVQYLLGFAVISVSLGLVLPAWKFIIQRQKILLRGPWEIPTAASMQLDAFMVSPETES